jgi:hypothetical protein
MNRPDLLYSKDHEVYFAQEYHQSLLQLVENERLINSLRPNKPDWIKQLRQKAGEYLIALGSKWVEGSAPAEPLTLTEECA